MKCPHCKEKILKVIIQQPPEMGLNDLDTPNDRYVIITCPLCDVIISVLLNSDRKE